MDKSLGIILVHKNKQTRKPLIDVACRTEVHGTDYCGPSVGGLVSPLQKLVEECCRWPVSFRSSPVGKTFLIHRKFLFNVSYTSSVADFLAATIAIDIFFI